MAEPITIACSLDADSYATRLEAIREIGETGFLRTQPRADGIGVDLFFQDGGGDSPPSPRVIEAEAKCCAFLELGRDADDDMLRLSISAPAGAEPVVRDLARSFESDQGTASQHSPFR